MFTRMWRTRKVLAELYRIDRILSEGAIPTRNTTDEYIRDRIAVHVASHTSIHNVANLEIYKSVFLSYTDKGLLPPYIVYADAFGITIDDTEDYAKLTAHLLLELNCKTITNIFKRLRIKTAPFTTTCTHDESKDLVRKDYILPPPAGIFAEYSFVNKHQNFGSVYDTSWFRYPYGTDKARKFLQNNNRFNDIQLTLFAEMLEVPMKDLLETTAVMLVMYPELADKVAVIDCYRGLGYNKVAITPFGMYPASVVPDTSICRYDLCINIYNQFKRNK